ncbi:hypothetical protein AKJ08_1645 [Vulgatibacter incomptus]|uniref:Outer membrane protein beta-barrel domain-containing protein n=1 Tax=Vulgatibacter incomptus TaxID=1391653 RepID=A0A0K1PCJ9_9BACT|nr:hypothetical protein AKJ08_1645 [Vulgatibacter incomptus]
MFLRLHAGPSYLRLSNSENSNKLGGGGLGFSLAAGHAIDSNLMLFGEFMMDRVSEPSLSVGSDSATLKKTSLSTMAFGPGVAYYLMPLNAYASGSLLLGNYSFAGNDLLLDTTSKMGFGAKLGVGKEWMLAPNFGLGVAGNAMFLRVAEKDSSAKSTAMVFGLAASGTYN